MHNRWTKVVVTRVRRGRAKSRRSRRARIATTVLLVTTLLSGALTAIALSSSPVAAAETGNWAELSPSTNPPGLVEPSMAFDQASHQMLLVGSVAGDTTEETWQFTGANWVQLTGVGGPPARVGASLAYDPASEDLVLFGGYSGTSYDGDTWVWDGGSWSELPVSTPTDPIPSPSPRDGAAFAYDSASQQLILFGGYNGSYQSDTWSYSDGSWTSLSPTTTPPGRSFAAMGYDPTVSGLVLFSGSQSPEYSDTYVWANGNWTPGYEADLCPSCSDSYNSPPVFADTAMAYDPAENLLLEVGGNLDGIEGTESAYEFDWTADNYYAPSPEPPARAYAAMAYDPDTQQLVLFGGTGSSNNSTWRDDTWVYGQDATSSCAGFSDNFAQDSALSSNWATNTPLIAALAAKQNETVETPQLTFTSGGATPGMDMQGAAGTGEMTAIESTQACAGPWTFTTEVEGLQSNGNTFGIYLANQDLSQVFSVEGNLNPKNGSFYGIYYGPGAAPDGGSAVVAQPAVDVNYTITITVDAAGDVNGSVNGGGATSLFDGSVGPGPLSIILGQREGVPLTVGANEAVWSFANLTTPATNSITASISASAPSVPSVETVPESALDTSATSSSETTTSDADASSAPLGSIDLSSSPLGSIPLGSIPLGSISVAGSNSIDQSLASTLLSELSINYPSGCGSAAPATPCTGWAGVLAGTDLANDPLQDVTLAEVLANPVTLAAFDSVDLAGLGLSSSPLGSIPLGSIALGSATLGSIPLNGSSDGAPALGAWCSALSSLGYSCSSDFGITPATGTTNVTLLDLALAGVPLGSIPLGSIPLGSIPLGSIPLGSIPLGSINLSSSPLGSIPLGSIPLGSIPLGSIPLGSIPLGSIPLGSIPLGSIGDLAAICTTSATFTCTGSGLTLADAAAAGALTPGATLAELGQYGTTTLAQVIGAYDSSSASVTGTDLAQLLDGDVTSTPGYPTLTIANLIGGLEPPSSYPWNDVNLASIPLAADESAGGSETLTTALNLTGPSGTANVAVTLPSGFAYVSGSALLDGAPITPVSTGPTITFDPTLSTGSHTLSLVANAGIGLGATTATVSASIGGSTAAPATTSVNVVDGTTGNDTAATATPLAPNTLNFGYLTSPTDTDLYAITVSQDQELSLSLSNLSSEYDLTVFAPTSGQLQGTPSQTIGGVTDDLPTLSPATSSEPVPSSSDIPVTPPTGYALYALSNNSGGADQTIQTAPLAAGTYLVQVSGYNGATSTNPYLLRAQLLGTSGSQSCPALNYTSSLPAAASAQPTIPANVNTLFLVDTQRMSGEYGASAEAAVLSDLQTVASDSTAGVVGAVVPVDAYATVQAAYAAFNSDPCSIQAANGVVAAISAVVDQLRATHPTIENLVIVGADDQIPFARVVDGTTVSNERDYAASTFAGENNVEADALGLGYYFSDDPFGAENPLGVGSATLYTPQLAIGRLIETPAEIENSLTRFVSSGGDLDATAGLSTGYSFLSSAAQEVAVNLASDAGLNPVTQLINETWTHQQLDTALTASPTPQVDSVNAHFDYSRALPAIGNQTGNQTDLFTTTDVSNNQSEYAGRLLFSMGCHAGLEIDSAEIGASGISTPVADWAKTFADAGSLWVANTGYGYGDTSTIAYSTKLMAMFAGHLNGSTTIGQALTEAKQQYAAGNAVLSPYDLKSLMESTFYGLPMYTLNSSPAPTTTTVTPPSTITDPVTNLTVAPIAAALSTGSGPGQLSELAGSNGTHYYQVNGSNSYNASTQTTEYRPIEPLTTINVTQPSTSSPGSLALVAHGALITGLSSTDVSNFSPTISNPALDSASNEVAPTIDNAAFPGALQRVANFQGFSSTGSGITQNQQLDLVAGQFIPNPATPGIGTERLFDSIDGEVYYTSPSSTDFTPPTIVSSQAVTTGSTTTFSVDATDPGAAIKRVYILYTDAASPGTWLPLDLFSTGGETYGGSAPATSSGTLDYIVQVVDAAGNVAVSNNQGTDFSSTTAKSTSSGPISVTLGGASETGGYYNGPVSAAISAPAGSTYVLDGSAPTAVPASPGTVTVSGEGLHVLVVSDPSGDVATEDIDISSVAPTISTTTSPLATNGYVPGAFGGNIGSELIINASADASITSVSYSESGAQTTASPVTATSVPLDVPLTKDGATTVLITVTDAAGLSTTSSVTVDVDATAPTVACSPPSSSAWQTSNVTVNCTATDAESGLATNSVFSSFTPASATFSLATTVSAGSASAAASTGTATVCNVLGNCTTVGPFGPYKVDLSSPVISTSTSPAGMNGYLPGAFSGSSGSVLKVSATSAAGLASIAYTESGAQTVTTPITSSTSPVNIPLTVNGTTIVTITATDVAGVTTTTKVTEMVDALAPAVSCSPPASATWYSSNVTVKCTATDGESGLSSTPLYSVFTPTQASFSLATTVASGQVNASASTASAKVCNVLGNCTTVGAFGPYKVDLSAPTISIIAPTASSYTIGAAVKVAFSCAEAGPAGVSSCIGTQSNGAALATGSPGTYAFKVTATDAAGNVATSSVTYTVSYAICPLSGSLTIGKTAVFVVALCNAKGQNVTSSSTTVTALNVDGSIAVVPAPGVKGTTFQYLGLFLPFPFFGLEYYAISTTGLAKGAHVLNISIAGDPNHHAISFTV